MITQTDQLQSINRQVEEIIEKVREIENNYAEEIENVHPIYRKSALNLVHYLGLRSFDIDHLQDQLRDLGLPSLSNVEAHVMKSLLTLSSILNHLLGNPVREKRQRCIFTISEDYLYFCNLRRCGITSGIYICICCFR